MSVSEDEADTPQASSEKVFKQLGFPQVETGKFNAQDFPKVAKCISKRTNKLSDMADKLKEVQKPSPQQTAFLGEC